MVLPHFSIHNMAYKALTQLERGTVNRPANPDYVGILLLVVVSKVRGQVLHNMHFIENLPSDKMWITIL